MSAAVDRLRALSAHLRGDADMTASERRCIADGLELWLSGGVELEEALGFERGAGKRRASTKAVIAERDRLVQEVAAEFFADLRPTEQARELHRRWSRYAAAAWPRERTLPEPPPRRTGTLERRLWEIMRVSTRVPKERSVRAILAANTPYSLPAPDATLSESDRS